MESLYLLLGLVVLLWAGLVFEEKVCNFIVAIFDASTETVAQLHWRAEAVLHAAFYGSAIATFLGVQHDSLTTKVISGVWFVLLLLYSRSIATRVTELEEHEDRARRRKIAGMTRDVIRSELRKSKDK